MLFRTLGLAAAALSLAACATVTRGKNDSWQVASNPPGARVETSNGFSCEATPCSMKIPRKAEFTATISKPGYKPETVEVTHKVKGGGGAAMAGNVLAGGIIGAGVDAASGAIYDLVPNPATVTLEKE
jgi:hypothetical protein